MCSSFAVALRIMALFVKLLLMACIALIFLCATNMHAFLYLNQFHWFRMGRNFTVVLFLGLGRICADAFAKLMGQGKPGTQQVHEASVLVVELCACMLLVSTVSSIFRAVDDWRARKKLKMAVDDMNDMQQSLEELRGSVTLHLVDRRPLKAKVDALRRLRDALPAAAGAEAEAETALRAAAAAQTNADSVLEEIKSHLDQTDTLIGAAQALKHSIQMQKSNAAMLQNRFSLLSKQAAAAAVAPAAARAPKNLHDVVHNLEDKLKTACEVEQRLKEDQAELSRCRDDALKYARDAATALAQAEEQKRVCKQRAEAAAKALADVKKQEEDMRKRPAKNRLRRAMLACLLLTSLYIAVKRSGTPSPQIRTTSSSTTQLALFENYFEKSDFSHFLLVALAEIVGASPPLPPNPPPNPTST